MVHRGLEILAKCIASLVLALAHNNNFVVTMPRAFKESHAIRRAGILDVPHAQTLELLGPKGHIEHLRRDAACSIAQSTPACSIIFTHREGKHGVSSAIFHAQNATGARTNLGGRFGSFHDFTGKRNRFLCREVRTSTNVVLSPHRVRISGVRLHPSILRKVLGQEVESRVQVPPLKMTDEQ